MSIWISFLTSAIVATVKQKIYMIYIPRFVVIFMLLTGLSVEQRIESVVIRRIVTAVS